MSRADYYFSSKHFRGLGKVFYLKVLREAGANTPTRRLLGSIVKEGDYGFLGLKEYPFPEHYFRPGIVIDKLVEAGGIIDTHANAIIGTDLANVSQTLKIDKSLGGNLKAEFPGAPASVGLEIDYSKIRRVEVEFGEGTKLEQIPEGYLRQLYDRYEGDDLQVATVMDDDKMIVDRIIVTPNVKYVVSSESEFDHRFNAKAEALNNSEFSVRYERNSSRSFSISVSNGGDYLAAIGAVQWSKLR